jgi:IS5 family transposase
MMHLEASPEAVCLRARQHGFNLSDTGAVQALYESPVLRGFAGVDLGRAAAPDETTILNSRHLLEKHALCGQIFDAVNLYLDSKGIRHKGRFGSCKRNNPATLNRSGKCAKISSSHDRSVAG